MMGPRARARRHRTSAVYVLLPLAFMSPAAGYAQITGSAHDFSGEAWSAGQICDVCHTPHGALPVPQPLWNHSVTTATFTVYSSPTLDETPLQPRGSSQMCLSCHDGTVAIDSYGGRTGSDYATGAALLGTNLGNDHPVSVYWNHQTEIDTCTGCHTAHPWGLDTEVPFEQRYVECSSCHDVHGGTAWPKLLRKSTVGSALCLHCHHK